MRVFLASSSSSSSSPYIPGVVVIQCTQQQRIIPIEWIDRRVGWGERENTSTTCTHTSLMPPPSSTIHSAFSLENLFLFFFLQDLIIIILSFSSMDPSDFSFRMRKWSDQTRFVFSPPFYSTSRLSIRIENGMGQWWKRGRNNEKMMKLTVISRREAYVGDEGDESYPQEP